MDDHCPVNGKREVYECAKQSCLNNPYSSVVFEVYDDVKEMGESPELLGKSPKLCRDTLRTWCFDVELSERQREVRLVVTTAGDGNTGDFANWVNA
ncbi:NPCBM/NEW2 domain-containing protein, partial [Pontiella agarivorans]